MRICYTIEVTLRTKFKEMPVSRRKHFLLLLLQCGMPLVGDTQSRFVRKKSEDALKIARLVQQDIMYKPKPVAALMASAQSEKENKNPRPRQPKARGKKNAKPEDQNQTVQPTNPPIKPASQQIPQQTS